MESGVLWITGLPNSGKTTIASLLQEEAHGIGLSTIWLDGDVLRRILPVDVGFSEVERRSLAHFYADLAGSISEQGHIVVISTVSLFHELHASNRANIRRYFEVLVQASSETRHVRDHRGIYRQGLHIVGADVPAEIPEDPDMVVVNDVGADPRWLAQTVLRAFMAGWARS